jgi:hypothetical protein
MIQTIEPNTSFIPLTQNKIAIVDTNDYDFLNQNKWHTYKICNTFYVYRRRHKNETFPTAKIAMHRLIMGAKKGEICDHIDGNGLNNKRDNLRKVSHRQNQQNRINDKRKSSKYPGVSWCNTYNKWVAQIDLNKHQTTLGRFNTEIEAFNKYKESLKEMTDEEVLIPND